MVDRLRAVRPEVLALGHVDVIGAEGGLRFVRVENLEGLEQVKLTRAWINSDNKWAYIRNC